MSQKSNILASILGSGQVPLPGSCENTTQDLQLHDGMSSSWESHLKAGKALLHTGSFFKSLLVPEEKEVGREKMYHFG